MRRLLCSTVLALLLAPCAPAGAEDYYLGSFRLALINDPVKIAFQSGSPAPTPDALQKGIRAGAASRNWKVTAEADGRIELHTVVRDEHLVWVEIAYDANGYRVRYLRSANLMYAAKNNLRVIHKNYNEWIDELASAINGVLDVRTNKSVGFAPLRAIDAVPFLKEKGRSAYKEFLEMGTPRAFAIAPNGAWGRAFRQSPLAKFDVTDAALERCSHRGEGQCRLYAIDSHVVWTQ